MTKATSKRPPMNSRTDEADKTQLALAIKQGDAYAKAAEHMMKVVADDGGDRLVSHFRIGYAVEAAEGMYMWDDGELTWMEPEEENLHVEVVVSDASDGRFIPDVKVLVTLIDPDGKNLGTHEQPFMWHPMLYHYGRNWNVPADGIYTMKIRVEPPTFMRHDDKNGLRYTEVEEVEFTNVNVTRGKA